MPSNQPFLGTSGIDFNNTINQSIQNRQFNPALSQFGTWTNMSPDGDQGNFAFSSNNERLNDDGTIKGPDGSILIQVGGFHRPDRDSEGDGLHFDHVTDDSRVTYDPEFGYVTTKDNISKNDGTFVDQYGGWLLAAPALIATGGAALAGSGATGAAGAIADESAGLAMTPGGAATGAAGGTAGGAAGGAAIDESAGLAMTPSGGAPAGAIPTIDIPPQIPPVTSPTLNPMTNGIINGAAPGSSSIMPQWYQDLSPASRSLLNSVGTSALSTGARAAIGAHAQQNQLEAQREAEERHRQDVIRRGQVDAFAPGAFTPRPRGIINGAQGGG